jgi:type IV pilus assembly protein PilN
MIRINLLTAERRQPTGGPPKPPSQPGALQFYVFLALFTGGAVAACAFLWWMKTAALKDLDTQIAAAEKRQRELQAIKVQVDALEAKRKTYQAKVDLIERLKAEQGGPVHMLDEISKALPDFVWLVTLDQSATAVKLGGESSSLTAVADFIAALQRSGWFPSVELISSQEQGGTVTFALGTTFQNQIAAQKAAAAAPPPAPPAPPGAAPR